MNFQSTHLQNELIRLAPLTPADFEKLFAVASDPLLWEQHPSKNRYQREIFQELFSNILLNNHAFLVFDAQTQQPIGSSSYYNWNAAMLTVTIGYTFLARSHWGGKYNNALKQLMLQHAFTFANQVWFEIAAVNIRSQKAIEKLGAVKIEEKKVLHPDNTYVQAYIYEITKEKWKLFNVPG